MAVLSFCNNDQELIRYSITSEYTSIGRSSSNDVCLPDAKISRTHFVITVKEGTFFITDKSTNGTFIAEKKIISQKLKNKDEIRIGDWIIKFETEDTFETKQVTRVLGSDPTEVLSFDPDSRTLKLRKAFLKFSGAKKQFPIKKSLFTLGKSGSCDLPLPDDSFVSSVHCQIEFKNGGYFLKDAQSTNGTFLFDHKIVEARLDESTTFRVGQTDIQFDYSEDETKLQALDTDLFEGIVGKSKSMRLIFSLLAQVAKSNTKILIQGEEGTGKTLIADTLHRLSGRSQGPFITVDCQAIAPDMLESEFFGHEQGGFTSATQKRAGAFEAGHGGTLYIDGVHRLPLDLQAKVLRAIENQEVKRIGSSQLIDVDCRIIASSDTNLLEQVGKGRFRADLFNDLNAIPILLLPLKDRKEDIPLLAEHFLRMAKGEAQYPNGFSKDALNYLDRATWTKNVKELYTLVHHAVISCKTDQIQVEHLSVPTDVLAEATALQTHIKAKMPAGSSLGDAERFRITNVWEKNSKNLRATAKELGISTKILKEKLQKYGITI